VPPKSLGRKQKSDKIKPVSGLDVDALLQSDSKRGKIDPDNAIPEFKQMVEYAEDDSVIEEAAKQFGNIIRSIVTDSLGDAGYDRAIECIGVLRKQMISYEAPHAYNSFVKDFKKRLLSGELGGDRRELWWQVKGARLGLIDHNASEPSKVTPEEAAEVRHLFMMGYGLPLTMLTVLQEVEHSRVYCI
jgi:ATP-dependent DNA helicase 2 subunit 2